MKDEEKKVNAAEEVKAEEKHGVELTEEELAKVAGGYHPPTSVVE